MSIQDGIKSSLFICLTAGLHINYSTDFHKKNWWKGDTYPMEENIRFRW